jgi:hypothetical protein
VEISSNPKITGRVLTKQLFVITFSSAPKRAEESAAL